MTDKQFTIVGEEYVGYTQGNAYIISNRECKFSLWESKEDAQKVCDCLNEQQDQISYWKHKVNSLLFILGQFDEEKVKGLLKEMEDE